MGKITTLQSPLEPVKMLQNLQKDTDKNEVPNKLEALHIQKEFDPSRSGRLKNGSME